MTREEIYAARRIDALVDQLYPDWQEELTAAVRYGMQLVTGKKVAAKSTAFVPPTVEEVQTYCHLRQNGINAQEFIDYYASVGWTVGKKPMKHWPSAINTWERNRQAKSGGKYQGLRDFVEGVQK